MFPTGVPVIVARAGEEVLAMTVDAISSPLAGVDACYALRCKVDYANALALIQP
jgi:hypothetical protein